MSGDFKTNNLMFSLCCLNFTDVKNLYDKLISYGIIKYSEYLLKLDERDTYSGILDYCENNNELEMFLQDNGFEDFENDEEEEKYEKMDNYEDSEKYIFIAGIKIGINFSSINHIKYEAEEIKHKISEFEDKHGRDAKVKLHKDILFEIRDKKLDERMFRVYCAIKAIVGEKELKRVTIERIKYAMYGYKSKKVYQKEFEMESENFKRNKKYESKMPVLLTDRQITTTIAKLKERELIDRYTYRRRATYYTTKPGLRGDKFAEKVSEFLAEKKVKQEYDNIQKEKINRLIENKFRKKMMEKINKELG